MRMALVVGVAALALGGCLHQKEIAAAEQAKAACGTQNFKTMTELARCQNDALRLTRPAWNADASLVELAMAQKLVLAEKVDRGQISRAEYDLEIAKMKYGFEREADQQRRQAAQSSPAAANFQNTLARNQAASPLNCTSTNMGAGTVNTTCY